MFAVGEGIDVTGLLQPVRAGFTRPTLTHIRFSPGSGNLAPTRVNPDRQLNAGAGDTPSHSRMRTGRTDGARHADRTSTLFISLSLTRGQRTHLPSLSLARIGARAASSLLPLSSGWLTVEYLIKPKLLRDIVFHVSHCHTAEERSVY
eukprot:1249769-Prymnesium_polylepis.1